MPKKGLTAVKVTFMTMTLVTLVTAVKFDYGTVLYIHHVLYRSALSGTRALQLRNAREARGGKKKSSRDEHGVLE